MSFRNRINKTGHCSILVVDDEPLVRTSLHHDLNELGYLVDVAENGRQAMELLSKAEYSLVITDLMMEDLDGLQLLEMIKQEQPEQAVFILTGFGEMDSAISALRLGADDYLLKPYDHGDMVARVGRCLARKSVNGPLKKKEGTLCLCSECKKVRNQSKGFAGEWMSIEEYLSSTTTDCLSHGICPDCYQQKIEELNQLIMYDNLKFR
ncbi:response regulator [Desulfogranum japonicum]|uniref:response regulator n=1 Tax=Desulfogranum japonicum TaxID=231447 RepID=UPI001378207C|nr:response regulator [Desulfogranum japonicum]